MKCEAVTESEMRGVHPPSPASVGELLDYVESLVDREHDYGTVVYAMSLAAVASFNYVAGRLGVTGFQASCADLDVIRRTRGLECPFIILTASDMLYPQYDVREKLEKAMAEWAEWAKTEARRMLAAESENAAQHVVDHWRKLASYGGTAADARLIAAAPDMLAALSALLGTNSSAPPDERCAAIDAAESAIAKATIAKQ